MVRREAGRPVIRQYQRQFDAAMEDDFNTPKALAVIFELVRRRDYLNAKDALKFLKRIDEFFNFIFWPKPKEKLSRGLLDLVKQRQEYRKQGEWRKADEIRNEITKLGWQIEDAKDGPKLKKIK